MPGPNARLGEHREEAVNLRHRRRKLVSRKRGRFVLLNLVVDLLYSVLDPRVRLESRAA